MIFDFSDFLLNHTESKDFAGNCNCRMAAYFAQAGCCYVTGEKLRPYHRELHHRLPRQYGGIDTPENLILLNKTVHQLVHATRAEDIEYLLKKANPNEEQLHRINQLRLEAKRQAIDR